MENIQKHREVQIIGQEDSRYSTMLLMTGKSAPEKLYGLGNVSLLKRRSVAIVGARKATPYGKWAAFNIGKKMAEYGIVVVSGMAYGCDAEAHRGALSVGGDTIAVLGSGVSVCYPKRNRLLYESIIDNGGLILSEHLPESPPLPVYFAERNRIISGLSEVIVVTEAGLSSGSLITAEFAAEQGRTVMAVPGNMNNINSLGCNKLIQDGAGIITSFGDVLEELGIRMNPNDKEKLAELNEKERKLYNLIRKYSEISVNLIARESGMNISEVNAIVAVLEIRGFVVSSMGKVYIAK